MNLINELMYWVTEGLLIPTLLVLLYFLVKSLIVLNTFLKEAYHRKKYSKLLLIKSILTVEKLQGITENQFIKSVKDLKLADNEVLEIKVLDDYEAFCEKKLSHPRMLAKIGPMLGLMLTLIPMGPALVGLANGDIASMAKHLQLAFSTTVIGVFVGGLGYAIQLVSFTWFKEEFNFLQFQAQLKRQKQPIYDQEEYHF
ncbi:MAG: MotA/TolQ/ExbB proton channel family protein [Cytophagales bacterium]